MKNKNIKNKPKKCGRWLFLHFRFLIKGIHQLNPQNLSSTTTAAKGGKRARKPSPIKTIYKELYL